MEVPRNLPNYAKKADPEKLVNLDCRHCKTSRWAVMNVAYPGKDALQDEDASYEATCLVCGNVDRSSSDWYRASTNCAAGELGYDPWIDDHEMPAGTTLHRGIADGMDASCAVVFFVTENFEDERWLAREVDHAVHRKIDRDDKFAIITLVLGGVVPRALKDLRLGERHASSRRDARDRQSAADRTRSTPLARQDLAEVTCKLRPGDPRARHDRQPTYIVASARA